MRNRKKLHLTNHDIDYRTYKNLTKKSWFFEMIRMIFNIEYQFIYLDCLNIKKNIYEQK